MALNTHVISILGCGWLGFPLAKSLVYDGHTVRGSTTSSDKLERLFDNDIIPHLLKVSDGIEGDVASFFNCDVLLINIPPGRRNPSVEIDHPNQVKAIIKQATNRKIEHIIFISSTGVYKNTQGKCDENISLEPSRTSGRALVRAEKMIQNYPHKWTILRMAGLVGGSRQPGRWFAGKREVPGGQTPVNMVHLDDCIAAIKKVINQGGTNTSYNICADLHPVKTDFYRQQAKKIGLEPPAFEEGVLPHKVIDNQKFKQTFDYQYIYPDPRNF